MIATCLWPTRAACSFLAAPSPRFISLGSAFSTVPGMSTSTSFQDNSTTARPKLESGVSPSVSCQAKSGDAKKFKTTATSLPTHLLIRLDTFSRIRTSPIAKWQVRVPEQTLFGEKSACVRPRANYIITVTKTSTWFRHRQAFLNFVNLSPFRNLTYQWVGQRTRAVTMVLRVSWTGLCASSFTRYPWLSCNVILLHGFEENIWCKGLYCPKRGEGDTDPETQYFAREYMQQRVCHIDWANQMQENIKAQFDDPSVLACFICSWVQLRAFGKKMRKRNTVCKYRHVYDVIPSWKLHVTRHVINHEYTRKRPAPCKSTFYFSLIVLPIVTATYLKTGRELNPFMCSQFPNVLNMWKG